MVMIRLMVRTREGVWQDEVDSWTSLAAVAELSAVSESFAELAEAVRTGLDVVHSSQPEEARV